MGEAEALEKEEEEGRGKNPKGGDDEDGDGESGSMKEIFSEEYDQDDFEYESSPFFDDDKKHQKNGDKDDEDDDEFDLIQMGTVNSALPPLTRSDCGLRIASILREICYDRFTPLNSKRWKEMIVQRWPE